MIMATTSQGTFNPENPTEMGITNSSQTSMVGILHEGVDVHTMGEEDSTMVEAEEEETAGERGVTTEVLLPLEEVAMTTTELLSHHQKIGLSCCPRMTALKESFSTSTTLE